MTVDGFAAHLAAEADDLDAALAKPVGSTTEEWQATLGDGPLVAANALYAAYSPTVMSSQGGSWLTTT